MLGGNRKGPLWANGPKKGRGKNYRFGTAMGNAIGRGIFQRRIPDIGTPHTVQLQSQPFKQQSFSKEQELHLLKQQAQILQRQADSILNRINELNKGEKEISAEESSLKACVAIDKCTGCGICMDVCKQGAITVDKLAEINLEKCEGCGICVNTCPNEALLLRSFENQHLTYTHK